MKSWRGLIALDGDGVLLDFHAAYADAWERAFGRRPALRDPLAYWPMDRWEVPRLERAQRERLRDVLDDDFWSTMPAIESAVDACHQLADAGYELVCVSAVQKEFESARLRNLQARGFPIERVVATANETSDISPKARALADLRPIAFVDDYAPYLRGIAPDIHAALLLREPNGSPNTGELLKLAHSTHDDLAEFTAWWLARTPAQRAE